VEPADSIIPGITGTALPQQWADEDTGQRHPGKLSGSEAESQPYDDARFFPPGKGGNPPFPYYSPRARSAENAREWRAFQQ
jgi:hypothetical protein